MGFIYLITNKINGKKYIGQTTRSVATRWNAHCRPKSYYCRLLHRAIQKYGRESFIIDTICESSILDELNIMEEKYIKEYNTLSPYGYNLLKGGMNKKHHPDTCKKMSLTKTGKKVPALSIKRGKMSAEFCLAVSRGKKGKPNGLLGKKRNFSCPSRRRPVVAIGNDSIINFDSINEAAAHFGVSHTNIVANLKGRKGKICGFTWKYRDGV